MRSSGDDSVQCGVLVKSSFHTPFRKMRPHIRNVWIAGLGAALLAPGPAAAQIRASEIGTMTQVIDGTKLSVTYSRPRMRGRQPLFGTPAAAWGTVWTPGANWATVLEVSKDVTLSGRPVPKGRYSVWMVLRESGDWTTVLDSKWHLYHMEPPDSNAAQIRISTPVSQAPFVDVLTWSMPELTVSGGTLAMQWGTTRATLKVGVTPSLDATLPAGDAQAYVGRYEYRVTKPSPGSDSVTAFIVTYENETLKARFDPNESYMQTFALIRVGPDIFTAGLYDKDGTIYEVLRPEMMLTFRRVTGQPITFSVRTEDDTLVATGTRKP